MTTRETIAIQMLDEAKAADYIGMSKSFLKKKRYEGPLENKLEGPAYFKIGRSVRYKIDDLDSWLARHRLYKQD